MCSHLAISAAEKCSESWAGSESSVHSAAWEPVHGPLHSWAALVMFQNSSMRLLDARAGKACTKQGPAVLAGSNTGTCMRFGAFRGVTGAEPTTFCAWPATVGISSSILTDLTAQTWQGPASCDPELATLSFPYPSSPLGLISHP